MKKYLTILLVASISAILVITAFSGAVMAGGKGQTKGKTEITKGAGNGAGNGNASGNSTGTTARAGNGNTGTGGPHRSDNSTDNQTQADNLTEKEIYWLTFMREEEKLARDVYLTLADQYPVSIFEKISLSEQRHMEAVKTLLDRYGLEDPVEGLAVGEFSSNTFQALYTELVERGAQSLTEAFMVGVEIEKTDIADLETALAAAAHNDITNVYTNLLKASYQHLKVFTYQLQMASSLSLIR